MMTNKTLYFFFAHFEVQMRKEGWLGPARSAKRMKIKYFRKMKQVPVASGTQD